MRITLTIAEVDEEQEALHHPVTGLSGHRQLVAHVLGVAAPLVDLGYDPESAGRAALLDLALRTDEGMHLATIGQAGSGVDPPALTVQVGRLIAGEAAGFDPRAVMDEILEHGYAYTPTPVHFGARTYTPDLVELYGRIADRRRTMSQDYLDNRTTIAGAVAMELDRLLPEDWRVPGTPDHGDHGDPQGGAGWHRMAAGIDPVMVNPDDPAGRPLPAEWAASDNVPLWMGQPITRAAVEALQRLTSDAWSVGPNTIAAGSPSQPVAVQATRGESPDAVTLYARGRTASDALCRLDQIVSRATAQDAPTFHVEPEPDDGILEYTPPRHLAALERIRDLVAELLARAEAGTLAPNTSHFRPLVHAGLWRALADAIGLDPASAREHLAWHHPTTLSRAEQNGAIGWQVLHNEYSDETYLVDLTRGGHIMLTLRPTEPITP